MKKILALIAAAAMVLTAGCRSEKKPEIMIAAAASLETAMENELIPMFEEKYGINAEGTYDSSGKLQQQIENGLDADVFISASKKQMTALDDKGYIADNSELLKNEMVLITASDTAVTSFTDIDKAEMIAIGDPESVPAGQYAKEILTSLGIWESASAHASLGTNVTEVLSWVAAGSAEVGIVYETDAALADVRIIAKAPENTLKEPVIYPVGVLKSSDNAEAAKKLEEFLHSDEAGAVFEKYGFTVN